MRREIDYYKGRSPLLYRFVHAIRGVRATWYKEPNFRIQLLSGLAVLSAAVIFPLTTIERAMLVLIVTLVLTLEIVNSIFERLLDIVHPQFSEEIAHVKDSMAGAVFVATSASVAIGVLVFLQPLLAFDTVFEQVLSGVRTGTFLKAADVITMIGDWKIVTLLTVLLALYLLFRRRLQDAAFLTSAMATGGIVVLLLKDLFERARPHGVVFVSASGYSFPSGHVFMATVFWFAAIYIATAKNRVRRYLWVFPIVLLPLVAMSRVVLSVHWFSDIAGGFLFGLFWILLWYGITQELFGGQGV